MGGLFIGDWGGLVERGGCWGLGVWFWVGCSWFVSGELGGKSMLGHKWVRGVVWGEFCVVGEWGGGGGGGFWGLGVSRGWGCVVVAGRDWLDSSCFVIWWGVGGVAPGVLGSFVWGGGGSVFCGLGCDWVLGLFGMCLVVVGGLWGCLGWVEGQGVWGGFGGYFG